MKQEDKTTKCQTRGRHEYRIVRENSKELIGVCPCGVVIHETRQG